MPTAGLIGGTGDLGTALSVHLVNGFDAVLLGSREKQKAEATVKKIIGDSSSSSKESSPEVKDKLKPATNQEVAESADVLFATLPAKHAIDAIKELSGHFRGNQLLICTAAPTPKVGSEYLPTLGNNDGGEGRDSITQSIKKIFALHSIEVAAAFQTVPAIALAGKEKFEAADVPVSCDDPETYEKVAKIVRQIPGLRPLYVGNLELSGMVEGLTSILLDVGMHNHMKSPTIRFNASVPSSSSTS